MFIIHLYTIYSIDLWGLDDNGEFQPVAPSIWYWLGLQSAINNVGSVVFTDLLTVHREYDKESFLLHNSLVFRSDLDKNKRLLYLFQRDLLQGISGQILESKESRDNHRQLQAVSSQSKMFAWMFIGLLNGCMLFYIFLFATSQDKENQSAWSKSFACWLLIEIFLVSTSMVLMMHVMLPSLIMGDVKQIKYKLVDSLVKYHEELTAAQHNKRDKHHHRYNVKENNAKQDNEEEHDDAKHLTSNNNNNTFNAAEYLFISHRLAKDFLHLKIAKIILRYHTVWPRQSYQHIADTSADYSTRYAALFRSAMVIAVFFLTSLLNLPNNVQDMVVQMSSVVVLGYTMLIHIRLYEIYPVLVIIPTIFIGILIHFIFQSHQKAKEDEVQKLLNAEKDKEKKEQGSEGLSVNNIELTSPAQLVLSSASSCASTTHPTHPDNHITGYTNHQPHHQMNRMQSEHGVWSDESYSLDSSEDEDDSSDSDDDINLPISQRKPRSISSSSDLDSADEKADDKASDISQTAPIGHLTRRQSLQHGIRILKNAKKDLSKEHGGRK
jgi:hypothetical protein